MRRSSNYMSTIAFILGLYCGYLLIQPDHMAENTIQTCFTPGDNCTSMITNTIDKAKTHIYVQAYSFTSTPISEALFRAANRGVKVHVLLDKSNTNKRHLPALQILTENKNINIQIDAPPGIAHNKVMIVDDIVITGSFNFTHAAQHRNTENVLRLVNKKIAEKYKQNWFKRQKQSALLR